MAFTVKYFMDKIREWNNYGDERSDEDIEKSTPKVSLMICMGMELETEIEELRNQLEPLKDAIRDLEEYKKTLEQEKAEAYMNSGK